MSEIHLCPNCIKYNKTCPIEPISKVKKCNQFRPKWAKLDKIEPKLK